MVAFRQTMWGLLSLAGSGFPGHILVDDDIGLGIGGQNGAAQARADVMGLTQGLAAVLLDVKVDKNPAARRAGL